MKLNFKYVIHNNIEDLNIYSFETDIDLINYVRKVADENDDEEMSITVLSEALNYLENYSSNLTLITNGII